MKKEDVKFLNENLYKFRKEKGISQEELGNVIGVSRQAVYKWESGERMPDINNLNSLCEYFNKNIEDFIDGANSLFKEKEENEISKKKINLQKMIVIILMVILALYILTVLIKSIFFGTMLLKINKYKNSNNYSYGKKSNYLNIDSYVDENGKREIYDMVILDYINYKDGKQKMLSLAETSIPIDGNYKTTANQWYISNSENIEVYSEYEERNQYYYGITDTMEKTPYEVVKPYVKEFYNLKSILNPFEILKIDFENKDLIFEKSNKRGLANGEVYVKEIVYIDLENGFLSKIENYEQDTLDFVYTYFDYNFDNIRDSQVDISEESKNEIIEKYDLEKKNELQSYVEENN